MDIGTVVESQAGEKPQLQPPRAFIGTVKQIAQACRTHSRAPQRDAGGLQIVRTEARVWELGLNQSVLNKFLTHISPN